MILGPKSSGIRGFLLIHTLLGSLCCFPPSHTSLRDLHQGHRPYHSDTEAPFIAVGPIPRGLVLVVWTERDEDIVHIISVRWATPVERSLFLTVRGRQP